MIETSSSDNSTIEQERIQEWRLEFCPWFSRFQETMDVFGVISSQLNSEPFVYSEPLGFPHKELTPHMQSPPPTRTSKPQRSKVGLAPTKIPLWLAAGSKSSQFAHTDTHNTPLHFNRKTVCACWKFESWLGLCRIDLSCPVCVADVARSIFTWF